MRWRKDSGKEGGREVGRRLESPQIERPQLWHGNQAREYRSPAVRPQIVVAASPAPAPASKSQRHSQQLRDSLQPARWTRSALVPTRVVVLH